MKSDHAPREPSELGAWSVRVEEVEERSGRRMGQRSRWERVLSNRAPGSSTVGQELTLSSPQLSLHVPFPRLTPRPRIRPARVDARSLTFYRGILDTSPVADRGREIFDRLGEILLAE